MAKRADGLMAIGPLAREISNSALHDHERLPVDVPADVPAELRGIPGHVDMVSVDAFQMAGRAEGSHIGVFVAAARRSKLYWWGVTWRELHTGLDQR